MPKEVNRKIIGRPTWRKVPRTKTRLELIACGGLRSRWQSSRVDMLLDRRHRAHGEPALERDLGVSEEQKGSQYCLSVQWGKGIVVQDESKEQSRSLGCSHHCLIVNDTEAPWWIKITRINSAALEPLKIKELFRKVEILRVSRRREESVSDVTFEIYRGWLPPIVLLTNDRKPLFCFVFKILCLVFCLCGDT